jgi:phage terminase large subunit-like protein
MTEVDVSTIPVLPANTHIPLFHTSLGDEAVAYAALCGLYLDDWQQEILKGLLSFRADNRMSARRALFLVPRQQGKTIILEARNLVGLFLLKEKVMLHTAHEYKTAVSTHRRVREHIERAGGDLPIPFDRIRFRENTTETSITIPKIVKNGRTVHPGSFLQFTPRTPGAGRGLTVELLIVDEAYAYTAAQASALDFTQNQSKNPQVIVTSSTGFPDSTELWALRDMGLSGERDNMLFVEYKAEDGSDPGDVEQWYHALPGLRTGRQRLEEIEDHYAKAKAKGDFTDFDREIRGLAATTDIGSRIPIVLWNDLRYPPEHSVNLPDKFAFAIDVDPDMSGASVYAVGQDSDGFFFMWQGAHDEGVNWVAPWLKIQQEQRPGHYVTVLDGYAPVGSLRPQFDDLGVEYVSLTSSQCMQACMQFESFARDNRLRHGSDSLLDEAVSNGVTRNVGSKGGWLWAPKIVGAEIRPLVASTYALFGLTAVKPPERRSGDFWY